MTNRIETFKPECRRLDLAGAMVTVWIEGRPCKDLVPIEIVRNGWPEFGWARLIHNPTACQNAERPRPEAMESRFSVTGQIRLRQSYNAGPPELTPTDLPLFAGQIDSMETIIGPDNERVEVVAKDFSSVLQRVTVYGQHVRSPAGSTILLPGVATIFNPAGHGNAATPVTAADGETRTIFSANDPGQKSWTCAEAICYLLDVYARPEQLRWPSVGQLLALTGQCPARDLDVTGRSLLEALQRCCEPAGIRFHFVPRLAETGPAQAIVFYRNGRGRTVELNCQPEGEALRPSQTNVAAYQSRKLLSPVTHRYIAQGDFKVYEATFDLVPAWDPALEGTDYYVFSPSTNPDFASVKDIYRKWALNESGDYTDAPYGRGEPYDFSAIFEGGDYAVRRRRFWPALSRDAKANSSSYCLEVSLDGGLHWSVYAHAFSNLLDECGIWLSSDHLDVYTWVAALKGVLRFRMTASVVSDERLTCTIADGPVGSTVPVIDHILTLPHRFQYRKVSSHSLLAQANASGPSDDVDDSAALHEFVRRHAIVSSATLETARVQTLCLDLHLHPGDRVASGPDSRDLLGIRRDNRSRTWIDRVHMDFKNQCTNLRLTRQRVYEE